VNQREVERLAEGNALQERIVFPGASYLSYVLETSAEPDAQASFREGMIRISAPVTEVKDWAASDASLGIYFDLPANDLVLKIAIEKDLECVDEPEEERDPYAFSREALKNC
jgi:hypothetical protein